MKYRIMFAWILLLGILFTGCTPENRKDGLKDKKIVVGTNAEYEPFEYLDDEGTLTGFDVELMNAVAEKLGVEIQWVDMAFESLIGSMEAGNVEIIAAAIGPTRERERSCEFSQVYYSGYQSIVTAEGTISKLDGLAGKSVAVLEGSLGDMIASGDNTDYGTINEVQVKRFKNASQAIQELENKAVDAVLLDSIIAERFVEDRKQLQSCPVESTREDTVFAIQKGDTQLTEAVDRALGELKDEGSYDAIYEKYFTE